MCFASQSHFMYVPFSTCHLKIFITPKISLLKFEKLATYIEYMLGLDWVAFFGTEKQYVKRESANTLTCLVSRSGTVFNVLRPLHFGDRPVCRVELGDLEITHFPRSDFFLLFLPQSCRPRINLWYLPHRLLTLYPFRNICYRRHGGDTISHNSSTKRSLLLFMFPSTFCYGEKF